jgi:hypothetical protein
VRVSRILRSARQCQLFSGTPAVIVLGRTTVPEIFIPNLETFKAQWTEFTFLYHTKVQFSRSRPKQGLGDPES